MDKDAETLLARQLSTLDGVAQVNVYGSQKYAVRVQPDPAALATPASASTSSPTPLARECQYRDRHLERTAQAR